VRAQRLGFSLADIRGLLAARRAGEGDETLLAVAEARYVALERQLTPLPVLRHERTHLLQDLRGEAAEGRGRGSTGCSTASAPTRCAACGGRAGAAA
jgi:DNA-binding transcriptional MerR regulator